MHTPAPQDRLFDLSLEFMDPLGSERAMRRSLGSKLKLQDKYILKDKLICLKSVTVAFGGVDYASHFPNIFSQHKM